MNIIVSLVIGGIVGWLAGKIMNSALKYNLQGTTQGNGLTGGVPPVRFSMQCSSCRLWRLRW